MTPLERLDKIRDYCVAMTARAQTIRIQQVQATTEAGWSDYLKHNGHRAWQELNKASEAAEAEIAKLKVQIKDLE